MQRLSLYIKAKGLGIKGELFIFIIIFSGLFSTIFARLFVEASGYTLILAFGGGVIMPFVLLSYSNNSDNENMLEDIKRIMELLKIQIHAGEYVFDALDNCSTYIKNTRLQKNIKKLVNDIYMSKDINDALEEFNSKFDNHHIDLLVIILKQANVAGYSINSIENAFNQIKDIEKAINIKQENNLERKAALLQLLIMTGIILLVGYCCIIEFKEIFILF